MVCPICTNELFSGHQAWHFLCDDCGYEKANFKPTINTYSAHLLIDESARETGLRELRISNFKKLINRIKQIKPAGGRLLDVGCAHGWFLEAAKNDFDVFGLEPDETIFNTTTQYGLPIRMGFFPKDLPPDEKFDVITFNDVIEHVPDILNTIKSCHTYLNSDGLLVLNLPSSKGIFYKLSNIFCRLGLTRFFDRLWQKDLPSPHLHYFNPSNIVTLLENNGFQVRKTGSLPTINFSGLYTRINYTGDLGFVIRNCLYLTVAIALPFLKILPRDVVYVIASRYE